MAESLSPASAGRNLPVCPFQQVMTGHLAIFTFSQELFAGKELKPEK